MDKKTVFFLLSPNTISQNRRWSTKSSTYYKHLTCTEMTCCRTGYRRLQNCPEISGECDHGPNEISCAKGAVLNASGSRDLLVRAPNPERSNWTSSCSSSMRPRTPSGIHLRKHTPQAEPGLCTRAGAELFRTGQPAHPSIRRTSADDWTAVGSGRRGQD